MISAILIIVGIIVVLAIALIALYNNLVADRCATPTAS